MVTDRLVAPAVGCYEGGLLAVVDEVRAQRMLSSWLSRLGPHRTMALITTGFGDVFFWDDASSGVAFLETQRGTVEFIDPDVEWFLSDFLLSPIVVKDILRKPHLELLVSRLGPLKYHEAFIPQPWPLLGGTGSLETCGKGDCSVYVDLVGQTLASQR